MRNQNSVLSYHLYVCPTYLYSFGHSRKKASFSQYDKRLHPTCFRIYLEIRYGTEPRTIQFVYYFFVSKFREIAYHIHHPYKLYVRPQIFMTDLPIYK